ncbi:hypothetical protein F5890DRAFT_1420566 [Lentinula detonsa]|uniref:CxC2-like cysteine cluster KDZ transposase-associated domain-containing protein n=1 Tax=Lentinula detonsa TaxID=2804962 RepID=A0AA38UN78_9AGAR|nr:hypothetical protein F5890DRAFT_1420566 [Lentinula detonsa]
MSQEADSRIGTRCFCDQAIRQVRCLECFQFAPLCRSCWIHAHQHQPFHWAHVWDTEHGYFHRQDISTILDSDLSAIPLGHDGNICPQASKPSLMTLVDHDTGVHATKVTFCGCRDSNKWRQLMDTNLFPATVAEPQTAFSFRTLRHWQLITLQSKITAYDYVRALRRQTDNVFTGNVPDVYKQFQFVSRIWPLLEAEKRFGGVYGNHMNELYPRHPQDNVMVYCPACPEAGVNMEPNWDKTPPELSRHLNTIFNTIDGNFKTGNYAKNNDPNDVSLFAGRAYMPNQKRHQHYLEAVPQIQKEKATCSHLKVENGANRAKFKNMSVTGNVNVQCSHMFVCSSVDMKGGENHATVDLAIKLRVECCRFDKDKQPHRVFSYDNMCSLAVNIVQRWLKFHKDDADVVQKASWTIPACHVNNHHEGCDYLYCYVYKMCMGHFHGETAEYAWAIFNAIGPSVLQMSIGHHIDTLIIHYGDWNWRKVVGLSRQLEKDLNDAKCKYVEKRDSFAGLCRLFDSKIVQWNAMDRSPHIDPNSKRTVFSIYSHNQEKSPTLKALVDKEMLSSDIIAVSSGNVKLGAVASWMMEGLRLFRLQNRIRMLARTSATPTKSLCNQQSKLSADLDAWRKLQKHYMVSIASRISRQPDEQHPEDQLLLLPSDFTPAECQQLRLIPLATKQIQMLEAMLGETIANLQTTVKNLSAAFERKIKDARGQDANTKSIVQIRKIEAKRNDLMGDYDLFREVLNALDGLDEGKWPPLALKDTFRKPTERRRNPGDSRVLEGNLWGMTSTGHARWALTNTEGLPSGKLLETLEHAEQPGINVDGWIWSAGRLKHMSMKEIEVWEETNNRIQWARSEADFERWQEQLEVKHADFMRFIRYAAYARDVWLKLAQGPCSSSLGHIAYGREHSNMWESLCAEAEGRYNHCGIPGLRIVTKGKTFVDNVAQWRQEEEKHFSFNQ